MSQFEIPTTSGCWVVPENFEVVKVMIAQRQLRVSDLKFDTSGQRQSFVKRLTLMALADECENRAPSVIAELARRLIQINVDQTAVSDTDYQ